MALPQHNDSDDFDPTRVLDGWTPELARPAAYQEATRLLDDWVPGGRRHPDPHELRWIEGAAPAEQPANGPPPRRRLAASLVDEIEDVVPLASESAMDITPGLAPRIVGEPTLDDLPLLLEVSAALAPADDPRLLDAWRPGAWIGAARRVFGAVAELAQTPQGPVVESFAPHLLLALWAPETQGQAPWGRWPHSVQLSAVEGSLVGLALVHQIPADAALWLMPPAAEDDVDWALLAELVLLHDPGLRPFQLRELRAFAAAEAERNFARLNGAYTQAAPGDAVRRRPG